MRYLELYDSEDDLLIAEDFGPEVTELVVSVDQGGIEGCVILERNQVEKLRKYLKYWLRATA